MNLFGSNNKDFFENVYNQDVPWEIGSIQPELKRLIEEFPPVGMILDIGCGSGESTFDLARMGYEVIGIDFIEKAIARANQKVREIEEVDKFNIRFINGDGLKPSRYIKGVGGIIDSGFIHLFSDNIIVEYLKELYQVLNPKGRIYLIEFAIDFNLPNTPRSITKEIIRELFNSDEWNILTLRDGIFNNKISPVLATVACIEKLT